MALCSPAFPGTSATTAPVATKRGCSTFNSLYSTPNKRICLNNNKIPVFGGIGFKGFYNSSLSSSEEDSDSDDDDGDADKQSPFEVIQVRKKLIPTRKSSVVLAVTGSETEIENLDCSTVHYTDGQEDGNCDNNNSVPIADRNARTRCFEYLIGAIDEAWARYCDATTSFEDDVFGSNKSGTSTRAYNGKLNDDNEDYDDEEEEDDSADETFDNNTDITDYSDFPHQQTIASTQASKQDQSSCQLQDLKVRLTKAKYYLQELVDSNDYREIELFWKRWDMIKYSTIELVEDDDDDEIVESTIEELENGRLFL
ncbi:conserved hypothetical protein [Candida dubliniensis CD36]|uniref:Uncharacterized protein n=1 Tax=Candida dubliniensis (strain CD36 / ATCC MYA-646 / CBS 7987 / NCPF 3949 / NRRL Y-17841) TaxID=573826 RepID=B9W9U8_CANDC|nr:conserved hypothetical protein [Candida dubliniensis CD36]CAX45585.1 conserved hypothetical protein [Candida dubliniensis CD36]